MTLEKFDKIKTDLQNIIDIQCSSGNWNCNPYMHGMANGLIMAQSIIEQCEPKFLDAPKIWLDDLPMPEHLPETVCEK